MVCARVKSSPLRPPPPFTGGQQKKHTHTHWEQNPNPSARLFQARTEVGGPNSWSRLMEFSHRLTHNHHDQSFLCDQPGRSACSVSVRACLASVPSSGHTVWGATALCSTVCVCRVCVRLCVCVLARQREQGKESGQPFKDQCVCVYVSV